MSFAPKFIAKQWTLTAAECYSIGCNCSKCYLKKILETKCLMKIIVFELVRKFGKPDLVKIQEQQKKGYTRNYKIRKSSTNGKKRK